MKLRSVLARFTKRGKKDRGLKLKKRNEKGVLSDFTETPRIIRNYYNQRYANKLHNLAETDKYLETTYLNSQSIQNRKSE